MTSNFSKHDGPFLFLAAVCLIYILAPFLVAGCGPADNKPAVHMLGVTAAPDTSMWFARVNLVMKDDNRRWSTGCGTLQLEPVWPSNEEIERFNTADQLMLPWDNRSWYALTFEEWRLISVKREKQQGGPRKAF